MMRRLKAAILSVMMYGMCIITAPAQTTGVIPIAWKSFKKGQPKDSTALLEKQLLLNALRYGLTTWYDSVKQFSRQQAPYLDFGGTDEHSIRATASEAFTIAVAIQTRIYQPASIGISLQGAKQRALKMIASLALRHKANTPNGWGDHWQSALWAGYAGAAGWMLWQQLQPEEQGWLQKMVVYEANRFNDYKVPYLRDKHGQFTGKGDDSKSEENSWNATILQVATAMMPHHPYYKVWMNKNIELMLSASARPQDVTSNEIYHGQKLSAILNGSNYNEDGTVINHGRIHPDYMACTSQTFFNALLFGLAKQPVPKAAFFNTDIIYQAMTDHVFSAPPYAAPGGTIYKPGSGDIYYPQVNDWGQKRKMHFALMDAQMHAFGKDSLASHNGAYWEPLHAREVLTMQQRSADGRTYQSIAEDTYKGREEWVAIQAAQAWLTKWLLHQQKPLITNKPY
jgi:hypothetical protein